MTDCPRCITCPSVKKGILLLTFKNANMNTTTTAALKKLDPLTLLVLKILPPTLVNANLNPPTNEDITTREVDLGWKKIGDDFDEWEKITNIRILKKSVSQKFETRIIAEDDFFGKFSLIDSLTDKGLTSTLLFPMMDESYILSSQKEIMQIAEDLDLVEDKALPISYNNDFDMLSDESFSRTFFYSIFAPLVSYQKENDPAFRSDLGPFVVDMPLQDLKVRSKYRPYGARVHFSDDQLVTGIYDYANDKMVKPGDDDGWVEAKLLAKVSAFTLVTVREHLTWTHLVLSNNITLHSTVELPPSHPLRRLLTIFTFRANEINLSAFGTLATESGLLHRSVGLEYESMQEIFDMSIEGCNIYQPFPDHKLAPAIAKLSEEGKFPYISEGREYWHIVHKFVSAWIVAAGDGISPKDAYTAAFYEGMQKSSKGQAYEIPGYKSNDDLINLVTQSIFTVTAYHELVGGVIDFIKQPNRAGFRCLRDHEGDTIDLQSWLLGLLIGATTGITMPRLMRPYANFFGVPVGGAPKYERSVWDNFINDLEEQSKKVQKDDAKRDVEFKYFDPARFECSVSV